MVLTRGGQYLRRSKHNNQWNKTNCILEVETRFPENQWLNYNLSKWHVYWYPPNMRCMAWCWPCLHLVQCVDFFRRCLGNFNGLVQDCNISIAITLRLNQCWPIVNWTRTNKLWWNHNRNSNIFIEENAFQNVVWKMSAVLSRPQYVKYYVLSFPIDEVVSLSNWSSLAGII